MLGQRYGIIADVHANMPALEVALDYLDMAGVDKILCLVGYGANPSECIQKVRDRVDVIAISGNHDRQVIGERDKRMRKTALQALEWTQDNISPNHARFLRNLPSGRVVDDLIIMVHGSLVEREGPLPAAQVVDIAIQTATALAHAHGKGVVHRDVKPTNLLLGRDSLIKLADLGLAKSLDAAGVSSITASGTVLAALAYIPPEQVTNAASVDGRADIYSLGATLYHLLTGVAPFRGTNIAELTQAILTEPPRSVRAYRDDVPAALDGAIARSMAKDPAQRFQDAQSLIGSLQAMRA